MEIMQFCINFLSSPYLLPSIASSVISFNQKKNTNYEPPHKNVIADLGVLFSGTLCHSLCTAWISLHRETTSPSTNKSLYQPVSIVNFLVIFGRKTTSSEGLKSGYLQRILHRSVAISHIWNTFQDPKSNGPGCIMFVLSFKPAVSEE